MSDHSKALWRESSGSGAVLDAVPVYLRFAGADVVFWPTWPEQLAFIDVDGTGDYSLLDLTPVYLVASGTDLVIDQVGPAAAVLADDGAGNIEVTSDLTRTPIADLFDDGLGNLILVLRASDRLEAVEIGGDTHLY